jgi:hypothetical protein
MYSTARYCPIFLGCHGPPPKDAGQAHRDSICDFVVTVTKSCPPIFRFASGRRGFVTAPVKFKKRSLREKIETDWSTPDGGRAENACLLRSRSSEGAVQDCGVREVRLTLQISLARNGPQAIFLPARAHMQITTSRESFIRSESGGR